MLRKFTSAGASITPTYAATNKSSCRSFFNREEQQRPAPLHSPSPALSSSTEAEGGSISAPKPLTPPAVPSLATTAPSGWLSPDRKERLRVFSSTFAKSFITETLAHTAVTRRAARSWARRVSRFGRRPSSSADERHRHHLSSSQISLNPILNSLAIRAPKPGGGTGSVPAPPTSSSPTNNNNNNDTNNKPPSAPNNGKTPSPAAGGKASAVTPADKKGRKKKGGNDDDDGDDDNDFDIEPDTVTPMVTKFVLAVFLLSGLLYWVSRPSGRLASWEAVMQRTEPLMRVDIYHEYAEFHFAEGPSMHVGLIGSDNHTEAKLKEVLSKCSIGEGFSTNWIGESFSESMLHFVGVFAWIVPFIFFPSFVMILTRAIGTAMTGVQEGKNKVTTKVMFTVQKGSNTRFSDIAGMTEAKQEVTEIVDFLKYPDRYTRLGAKVPTGALLLGPPGTGKTLLAKAVAGEAGVAFIPCTGSDFVEMYVGMGALRVRQLFELAKKQRCIIYIDEIDAIGLKRSGAGHGEKQEQEHTLNELLTQLDGFGSKRGEVMILASSNVSQQELDPALIRPGRFDRLVNVDAPVIKERIDIFKVHLSNLRLVAPPPEPVVEDGEATLAALNLIVTKDDGTAVTVTDPADGATAADKADPAQPLSAAAAADKISTMLATDAAERDSARAAPIPAASMPATTASTASTPTSSTTPTSASSAVAIIPGTDFGESLLSEEEEENSKKDVVRAKMAAAAKSALEEKLSKLTEEERHLVNNYASRMAELCPGFVGADIMNVCNEAAILAARESCNCVTISHLERSIDRVLAGIEHRSRVLSEFERTVVAHHEAGHAVAGWFLGRADPLMKVSIVPRGGSALGYAQYLPNENQLRTSNEIKDSICVTLGGRVAERIFFNHLSTGASDDLRKVTRMAYMHVSAFNTTTAHSAPGTSSTKYVKPYGAAISDKIDVAAKQLVDDLFARTLQLLTEKKAEMELLAKHLLEHEVLTHADVVQYLGPRPPRPSDQLTYYARKVSSDANNNNNSTGGSDSSQNAAGAAVAPA